MCGCERERKCRDVGERESFFRAFSILIRIVARKFDKSTLEFDTNFIINGFKNKKKEKKQTMCSPHMNFYVTTCFNENDVTYTIYALMIHKR